MHAARFLLRLTALLALAVATAPAAHAEDIDIYSLPNTEGFRPNVLILLDNSANWSASISTPICSAAGAAVRASSPNKEEGTKMGAQKCALYRLIASMSVADLSQFNFALMMFNESPDAGGYPRKAFFQVTDAAGKQAMLDTMSGLQINADKTNAASTAESFYEAYQWFMGSSVHLGNKTTAKHDPAAFSDAARLDMFRQALAVQKTT